MSKYARAIVAGLIAAVVMSFLMNFVFEGATPYIYGTFTGIFVAYIFDNLAGNRKVATDDGGEKEAEGRAGGKLRWVRPRSAP
jgi:hypothetical protein